jgi:hypothetical protein
VPLNSLSENYTKAAIGRVPLGRRYWVTPGTAAYAKGNDSLFAIALKKPRAVANKKSPSHLSMGDDTHCEG